VLDGAVIAHCKPRHRHQEFLAFLRHIKANVPAQLDVHLVVDNCATHKHPKVRAWLARRPRWHIHFTLT
jgi:putative transposase